MTEQTVIVGKRTGVGRKTYHTRRCRAVEDRIEPENEREVRLSRLDDSWSECMYCQGYEPASSEHRDPDSYDDSTYRMLCKLGPDAIQR